MMNKPAPEEPMIQPGQIMFDDKSGTTREVSPEENPSRESLPVIESELVTLLSDPDQRWTKTYQLMEVVRDQELWKTVAGPDGTPLYRSWNAWVNHLSSISSRHVSTLWNYYNAGHVYRQYEEDCAARGLDKPPALNHITVSPTSLSNAGRIVGRRDNEKARDVRIRVVQSVLNGRVTKRQMEQAAGAARRGRAIATGTRGHAANRYDRDRQPDDHGAGVTAAQIVLALQKGDWFPHADITGGNPFGKVDMSRLFPEFPIDRENTKSVTRVDAMMVETLSTRNHHEVVLRGVEIKVDHHDLLNDQKMGDYARCSDYFYLAVPKGIEQDALDYADPAWGILVYHAGHMEVKREPERLDCPERDLALTNVILKMA